MPSTNAFFSAFGCSRWRDGCEYRLAKDYRGVALTRAMVRELTSRQILLRPVQIPEQGPRILCLTQQGQPFDLEVPSRDAQQKRTRRKTAARKRPGSAGA